MCLSKRGDVRFAPKATQLLRGNEVTRRPAGAPIGFIHDAVAQSR